MAMKPRFRPVIRVFVSSTFSDLKEERNILQREVFPRLGQYCLVRGFQFQAIDLRWGVPGEAGLDHRTMQICCEELRRAQEISPRPNFLVLLGDRYGWQPLAEMVSESEFHWLEEAARQLDAEPSRDKQISTSAMQVLQTWYRRDDNADPAEYILRSRHDTPDSGDYTGNSAPSKWKNVEKMLWAIINRAYPPSDLVGRFGHIPGLDEPLLPIVKFQASATEQEIWRGALAVPDANDHVVAWYRTIRNRSQYVSDQRARDFFDQDATLHRAVSELREHLSRKLHKGDDNGIIPAEVDLLPTDDGQRLEITRDHLATMCDQVEKKLVRIIEKEIAEYWRPTTAVTSAMTTMEPIFGASEARKLELERLAHERFGEGRAPRGLFIGRENELEGIARYLSDDNDHKPLVVYGPSGTGKTALLARAAQLAEEAGRRVLIRFLGTTPQSSNLRGLLINLCRALRPAEEVEKEVPVELREVQEEFDKQLASATADKPILLVLDALDQLDGADGARQTYWLRTPLPPHVKVVLSCICDPEGPDNLNEPYLALERRKLLEGQDGQCRAIAVESLSADEAMSLLGRWLEQSDPSSKQKRRITEEQRHVIAAHIQPEAATACRRPLYLRILFEQCRLWPSYKLVKPEDLGENTAALLGSLFDHLAEPVVHGRILVESALGYIASARRGLSENEILEVLWADPDYKLYLNAEVAKTTNELPAEAFRIPVAIWSRLRHDLDPYLAEHAAPGGAVLNCYHREVARVVAKRFLDDAAQRVLRHGRLGKYFESDRQPWWQEVQEAKHAVDPTARKRLPNARRATELPWQLLREAEASDPHSENLAVWNAAVDLLCDMEFVEAKCAAGLVFELQEDYRDARRLLPEAQNELRLEEAHRADSARWIKGITEYARQWSERRDHIKRGEHVEEAEPVLPVPPATCRMWNEEEIVADRLRIMQSPKRLDRLRAFDNFIAAECSMLLIHSIRPGFVLQQAFNHADSGPVGEAAERWQASGIMWLKSRDRRAYTPRPACLRLLQTPGNEASATADGLQVLASGSDSILRLWDLQTGNLIRALEVENTKFTSVSVTPDGRRGITGSRDGRVRMWDLENGNCLINLQAHAAGTGDSFGVCVGVTPDGRRAVSGSEDGSEKNTLRVWDLDSGILLRDLEGHSNVASVSVSADGRYLVSAGNWDKTLRVWDLDSGQCLHILRGHTGRVTAVSMTPDGTRAVSYGSDNMLRVWNLKTAVCVRVLHVSPGDASGVIERVMVTPDGRRAVSSDDLTLRVWDLETGACLRVLEGNSSYIFSVSVTADGRRAVSGSPDDLRIWDLEMGAGVRAPRHRGGTDWGAPGNGLDVTPDGQRVVFGGEDGLLWIWDVTRGAVFRSLKGHSGWIYSVCITPDGRHALSGSIDTTLRVWDLETGHCLRALEGHTHRVTSIRVTPNGRCAVSTSHDNTLRLWDLASGVCLRTLEGHADRVNCVSIAPDGRHAISASDDKTLRYWNLDTGECTFSLEGNTFRVGSVCMVQDGSRAVSAAFDTVAIWDLETRRCIRILEGHSPLVRHVKVTPDGKSIVSAGWDRTVRVWDLETGVCRIVGVVPDWVEALALARDGLIYAGLQSGDISSYSLIGIPLGPAIVTPFSTGESDYEEWLRIGLDRSRRNKGPDHAEVAAHLTALAVHLESAGRKEEARAFRREREQMLEQEARKRQTAKLADEAQEVQDKVGQLSPVDTQMLASLIAKVQREVRSRMGNTDEAEKEIAKRVLRLVAKNLTGPMYVPGGSLDAGAINGFVDQFEARSGLEDRRRSALQAYLDGDYALAEEGLRSLLEEGFDVPSTHCHLARLLMVQDRLKEAWTEIAAAWKHRAGAPLYMVPRILWLQLAMLFLAPPEEHASSSIQLTLGYLKTSLAREGAQMEWRMEPVLAHLHRKLPSEEYQLLAVLVAALSDATNLPGLEKFPAWHDAQSQPLE